LKDRIFNVKENKEKRRMSRNSPTKPESIFWGRVKGRQISNCKFRRQHGIGNYIVDFYCPEVKLAIEIDGESHYKKRAVEYDKRRTKYIESLGIKLIRFTNDDIMKNIDGAMRTIMDLTTPNPSLNKEWDQ